MKVETMQIVYGGILGFALIALGVLVGLAWQDLRRRLRDRRRRRELAAAFPTASVQRVRVEAWQRDRLDIRPAMNRRRS